MRIQKQCRALVDDLAQYTSAELPIEVLQYLDAQKEHYVDVDPDIVVHTDAHGNTVCVGGSLSGDLTMAHACFIGEGVDVVIEEGCTVIGCVFSRLDCSVITDEDYAEIHVTHKIVIRKNSVLVGCLLRETCDIGENAVMANSAISQTNLGPNSRVFCSSVLTRFSYVGEGFTAVQTIFHTDRCEAGKNIFMMSGKWGIIPWEKASTALHTTILVRCRELAFYNVILKTMRDTMYSSLQKWDDIKKAHDIGSDKNYRAYAYTALPVYRRQYQKLADMANLLQLCNNIDISLYPGVDKKLSALRPMLVSFYDHYRDEDDAAQFQIRPAVKTSQQFYSYRPRIHIGDNLQAFSAIMLMVSRISESNRHKRFYAGPSEEGFDHFAWEKMKDEPYDVWIGNDCTFMSSNSLVVDYIPSQYTGVGRFVMKDGATRYAYTENYWCRDNLTINLANSDVAANTYSGYQASVMEYVLEENSKGFFFGLNCSSDSGNMKSHSHIWRIKVKRNTMAII